MFQERPLTVTAGRPRTPLFGVGINDSPYVVSYLDQAGKMQTCPYYSTWGNILERCFSERFHRKQPSYRGCTLEDSWKTFSNFRKWMEMQDWQGKAIDKDLLVQGNKHYGPQTCIFIPKGLNSLLIMRGNHRGPYPLGVVLSKTNGYQYFAARCSFYGKQKTLGTYKTVEAASQKYQEEKRKYVAEIAATQSDPIIKAALLRFSFS